MDVSEAAQPPGRALTGSVLSDAYRDHGVLRELREEFLAGDYVKLPGLLRPEAFALLRAELKRIESAAVARDLYVDGTRRLLSTIGGERLKHLSPALVALYTNRGLRAMLAAVAGARVYDWPNPSESVVANFEASVGATHGWHLDDLAYPLIVHVEAPPAEAGALVEFVRDWRALSARRGGASGADIESLVVECRRLGLVRAAHHAAGDAYLLRADRCLHRVTELTREGARRAVVILAFTDTPDSAVPTSLIYAES
jgi:hypothetical protein